MLCCVEFLEYSEVKENWKDQFSFCFPAFSQRHGNSTECFCFAVRVSDQRAEAERQLPRESFPSKGLAVLVGSRLLETSWSSTLQALSLQLLRSNLLGPVVPQSAEKPRGKSTSERDEEQPRGCPETWERGVREATCKRRRMRRAGLGGARGTGLPGTRAASWHEDRWQSVAGASWVLCVGACVEFNPCPALRRASRDSGKQWER